MKKVMMIAVMTIICGAFAGCGNHDAPLSAAVEKEKATTMYNMSAVYTEGNYSYIPINMILTLSGAGDDSRTDMIPRVIGIMNAFENSHPELEVVSWTIDKKEDGNDYLKVFGIWVSHRNRNGEHLPSSSTHKKRGEIGRYPNTDREVIFSK